MVGTLISCIVIYYMIRLGALIIIGISIDDWNVSIPNMKTLILEPFNYRKYIFFETRCEYEAYEKRQMEKGDRRWWR